MKKEMLRFCPEFGCLWTLVNCPTIVSFVNKFTSSHLVLLFSNFTIPKVCSANPSCLSSVLFELLLSD